MRGRGRPVLGGAGGLFLGLFLAFDLLMFKVIRSDSPLFVVLPVGLMVLGVVLGATAPFGRRRARR